MSPKLPHHKVRNGTIKYYANIPIAIATVLWKCTASCRVIPVALCILGRWPSCLRSNCQNAWLRQSTAHLVWKWFILKYISQMFSQFTLKRWMSEDFTMSSALNFEHRGLSTVCHSKYTTTMKSLRDTCHLFLLEAETSRKTLHVYR